MLIYNVNSTPPSGPYHGAGTIRLHNFGKFPFLEKVITLHWHGVGAFPPSCLSPPINFWARPHSSTQATSSLRVSGLSGVHLPFNCLSPKACLTYVPHGLPLPLLSARLYSHHSSYQPLYTPLPHPTPPCDSFIFT